MTARSEVTACPPLPTYSNDLRRRAADELDQLPADSALGVLVVDYGKLRDACRALK